MVLFFFFICAFTGNTESTVARDSHYKSVSEQHSYANALNDNLQFSTPKNIVRSVGNTDFNPVSDSYKVICSNRSIHQQFVVLLKTELPKRPGIPYRFYYRYCPDNSDDLPALS